MKSIVSSIFLGASLASSAAVPGGPAFIPQVNTYQFKVGHSTVAFNKKDDNLLAVTDNFIQSDSTTFPSNWTIVPSEDGFMSIQMNHKCWEIPGTFSLSNSLDVNKCKKDKDQNFRFQEVGVNMVNIMTRDKGVVGREGRCLVVDHKNKIKMGKKGEEACATFTMVKV
jgi:hypothetical protein